MAIAKDSAVEMRGILQFPKLLLLIGTQWFFNHVLVVVQASSSDVAVHQVLAHCFCPCSCSFCIIVRWRYPIQPPAQLAMPLHGNLNKSFRGAHGLGFKLLQNI